MRAKKVCPVGRTKTRLGQSPWAKANPSPYVIAASAMPTIVISVPLAHHDRVVTSDLAAPTAKWATVLITKEAITAGIPTVKKKGMIGKKPPKAGDTPAANRARNRVGEVS